MSERWRWAAGCRDGSLMTTELGETGPSKSESDSRRREGGQRSGAEDRRGVAAVAVGIGEPTGEQRQAAVVMGGGG